MDDKKQETTKLSGISAESNSEEEKIVDEPNYSRLELSKKNTEYVFQLRKLLINENQYSEEQADKYINNILGEIIVAQRKGLPANRLYGSPRKKVTDLIKTEKEKPATNFGLLWLDNSVIFAFLISAMTCLMLLMNNTESTSARANGITTIILMSAEFGCPWAYFTRWSMQPKSKRSSWITLIGVMALGFVGLFVVTAITAILPSAFNPVFNAFVYLVITIMLFGVHYYLKSKYNIKGTIF